MPQNLQDLALCSNWNNALAQTSLPQSVIMLAQMLDRAVAMTGHELTKLEADLWMDKLSRQPVEVIKYAFDQWASESEFFPKLPRILELVAEFHGNTAAARKLKETARRNEENRNTRERLKAEGLPYGNEQLRQVLKQAMERVKSMPDYPWLSEEERKELHEKVARLKNYKRNRAAAPAPAESPQKSRIMKAIDALKVGRRETPQDVAPSPSARDPSEAPV
jgi:hypothetical protein